MKLTTLKEVLTSLVENKTLVDKDGYIFRLAGDDIVASSPDDRSYEGFFSLYDIALPCTIKEEPEYLYEYIGSFDGVRWDIARRPLPNDDLAKTYFGRGWVVHKTGRKFQLVDGVPKVITTEK